jgi:hypothetical protein
MNIRTVLLSAGIGIFALGAASLPTKAEDGRNGAAAIGAIAGFAAGAAAPQEGYYGRRQAYYGGPRRAYYGGPRYRDGGDWRRRGGGDGDEDSWRARRGWCSYHPDRC